MPTPDFMEQIGLVYIISEEGRRGATIEDFNSGKAAIGTGAYKFKSTGRRATALVLTRNDGYWGEKPAFENVTIKFITNDAARVAALRSGTVDLIDPVPPGDVKTCQGIPTSSSSRSPRPALIYLAPRQRTATRALRHRATTASRSTTIR